MVASDTTQTYHVAVVGYLACGLVLTTSSVNSLVYSANGAKEAASAGFILLSMVTVRCLHTSSVLTQSNGHVVFCCVLGITLTEPTTDRLDLLFRLCTFGCAAGLP